jgi:hypothetical protein
MLRDGRARDHTPALCAALAEATAARAPKVGFATDEPSRTLGSQLNAKTVGGREATLFYEDLSPYRYSAAPTGLPGVVNIGWLGTSSPHTGNVETALLARLELFSRVQVLRTRGFHVCGLCKVAKGNGEVWIAGEDRQVFASPSMLLHYITAHGYLPPAAFLEALRRSSAAPLPDSECEARIRAHRRKLEEAPALEDILVPYYSVKVYWGLDLFADLGAFEAFLSSRFPHRFVSVAKGERGYFIRAECEHPRDLLRDLAIELQPLQRAPFACTFRLLYVGGVEQVCSIDQPATPMT